jgi:hypothetical protein
MPSTSANDALTAHPWAPATHEGAQIIYGHGAELGDFKVFAGHLKSTLVGKYGRHLSMQYIDDKNLFLEFLKQPSPGFKIKEFHVFSHAFGGGLALGYHLPADDLLRDRLYDASVRRGTPVTYEEVVRTEKGLLLLGDLQRELRDSAAMKGIREKFSRDAFLKIWGCMSGLEHLFSDEPGTYYWEALNTPYAGPDGARNLKPFAQHLANFLRIKVYGAKSGSHVEAWHEGAWVTSDRYKILTGKYPSPKLRHRLHPDRGDYALFEPQP